MSPKQWAWTTVLLQQNLHDPSLDALFLTSMLILAWFEFLGYLVGVEVCCQGLEGRAGVQSQGLSFWGGTWLKTRLYKALQKPTASSAFQLNVYHFSTRLRLIADSSTKNKVICNPLYEIWCIWCLSARGPQTGSLFLKKSLDTNAWISGRELFTRLV